LFFYPPAKTIKEAFNKEKNPEMISQKKNIKQEDD